jgi:cyclophilin family peptidyl-prolyl cis-trans isomerase
VITDFLVQCGRVEGDASAPGYTVPDELPAPGQYREGIVAMANQGSPDTAGGEWFIVVGPKGAGLPPAFTIIGTVTLGQDVVQAIEDLADPVAVDGIPPAGGAITVLSVTVTEI